MSRTKPTTIEARIDSDSGETRYPEMNEPARMAADRSFRMSTSLSSLVCAKL
jgi:hypothetical protein